MTLSSYSDSLGSFVATYHFNNLQDSSSSLEVGTVPKLHPLRVAPVLVGQKIHVPRTADTKNAKNIMLLEAAIRSHGARGSIERGIGGYC